MMTLGRRRFLQGTTAVALSALCPPLALAENQTPSPDPFQLAAELKKLASSSGRPIMDAGTGNPNFLHVTARRAHSQLYQATLGLTGSSGLRPSRSGVGMRLAELVRGLPSDTGLAQAVLEKAQEVSGLTSDEVADQLLQMLLGTTYGGFQALARSAAVGYQKQELGLASDGDWNFFPTSGASEALSLVFECFKKEGVLGPDKSLAEIVPTFSPFTIWPALKGDYEIHSVPLDPGRWSLSEQSLERLTDPSVKVVYLVDPGNPVPTALDGASVDRFVRLVKERRSDLLILADSVYGCFPEEWYPVISELPENTIGIGSWSKHFGATGWRLGCLLVHSSCILGKQLSRPLESFVEPGPVGLPQQGMLTVFSLTQLTRWGLEYDEHLKQILTLRWQALYLGLGMPAPLSERYTKFFATVSLEEVADSNDLRPWPKDRELDYLRKLAATHGAICLPCSGFSGPLGVLRISLASLSEKQAERLGRSIVQTLKQG